MVLLDGGVVRVVGCCEVRMLLWLVMALGEGGCVLQDVLLHEMGYMVEQACEIQPESQR